MEGALLSINNTLKEKEGLLLWKVPSPLHTLSELNCFCWTKLRLHQLIRRIHHYLQGFIHPRWCRISSINSMSPNNPLTPNVCCFFHTRKTTNRWFIKTIQEQSGFATLEIAWCIHPTNLSSHLTTSRREKAMITHQPQLAVPRTPNCDCCKLVNLIPRTTLAILWWVFD